MLNAFQEFRIGDVLACEDHPFVQLGLNASLKETLPHLRSLRLAGSGKEALRLAQEKRPDLVIVDLGLPDMSGLELIQLLREMWTDLKILVVTSCDNPSTLLQAKRSGVVGIMQKSSSTELLAHALESVRSGRTLFLDPAVSGLLQEHEEIEFTPREYEILQEIIQGLSNQQIADKLNCALTNVRFHRANILHKANVRSGAELAAWFSRGQSKRN